MMFTSHDVIKQPMPGGARRLTADKDKKNQTSSVNSLDNGGFYKKHMSDRSTPVKTCAIDELLDIKLTIDNAINEENINIPPMWFEHGAPIYIYKYRQCDNFDCTVNIR